MLARIEGTLQHCENERRHLCLTVLCGCIQILDAINHPFGRVFSSGRISALLANSTSTELLINDDLDPQRNSE